jgi:pimeloyl-ACP methyl ester carboxylesterase
MVLHSPVEQKLAEIWCQILQLDQVDRRDDFFDLGGDSIAAACLVVEIHRVFRRSLPLTSVLKAPTVEKMALVLNRPDNLPPGSLLTALQPDGSKPPLVCVHPVGGSVHSFAELARYFSPDQPFYAIRGAEDGDEEPVPASLAELAAGYVKEIRTHWPEGPYYLGGYSFGGSAALEIAQQLVAQGQHVAFLAILDHTPPPQRFRGFDWTPSTLREFVLNLLWWLRDDLFRS